LPVLGCIRCPKLSIHRRERTDLTRPLCRAVNFQKSGSERAQIAFVCQLFVKDRVNELISFQMLDVGDWRHIAVCNFVCNGVGERSGRIVLRGFAQVVPIKAFCPHFADVL
jgi:hypothetical protein